MLGYRVWYARVLGLDGYAAVPRVGLGADSSSLMPLR
jgi:hypothetical protein